MDFKSVTTDCWFVSRSGVLSSHWLPFANAIREAVPHFQTKEN